MTNCLFRDDRDIQCVFDVDRIHARDYHLCAGRRVYDMELTVRRGVSLAGINLDAEPGVPPELVVRGDVATADGLRYEFGTAGSDGSLCLTRVTDAGSGMLVALYSTRTAAEAYGAAEVKHAGYVERRDLMLARVA